MNSPKLYITVGISGSGKSFYANQLCKSEDFVQVNNDDLRKMMFCIKHWDEYDYDNNEKLITLARYNLISALLKERKNIIVSNIHLSLKHLEYYKNLALDNGYEFKVIIFDTPLDICVERNSRRTEMKLNTNVIVNQRVQFCKIYDNLLNYDHEIIHNY